MQRYTRRWLSPLFALALSGCVSLSGEYDSAKRAGLSETYRSYDCRNAAAQISGPPSQCAASADTATHDKRIERRKHWLTVGIVTAALYFIARTWLHKDPKTTISTPGTGEPSNPCDTPTTFGRPPWCDVGQ